MASSGTNQVVGNDVTSAVPQEVQQFATVSNPDTLGVDSVIDVWSSPAPLTARSRPSKLDRGEPVPAIFSIASPDHCAVDGLAAACARLA